jgi:ABC-2 type transport system permease protein
MGIFLLFAILSTESSDESEISTMTNHKINYAVINPEQDSEIVKGLLSYLKDHANLVSIPKGKEAQQDALFYRKVEYIIDIPSGFNDAILRGETVKLGKTTVPDATSGVFMDMLINKYLNTTKIYLGNTQNLSQKEIVDQVLDDLSNKTKVVIQNDSNGNQDYFHAKYYFNFLTYSIFSILILGICSVMIVFNNADLKKRNYASPVKLKSINLQLVLGCLSFAAFSWVISVIPSFIMLKDVMTTKIGALLLLSSLLFTFTALSISFLIASFVTSRNAMSAVANVVALGNGFMGGVFVEQDFLGKTVLTIGSFTPTYWYVKAVDAIVELNQFHFEDLKPILGNLLVVVAFGASSLMICLVYLKQKRQSF